MAFLKSCINCAVEFTTTQSKAKFCSRACSGKERSSSDLPCINCGKIVEVPRYRVPKFRFCSRKCAWVYKCARDLVVKTCPTCGEDFSCAKRIGNSRMYCSDKCAYEATKECGSVALECTVCQKPFRRSPSKVNDGPPCCSIQCRGALFRTSKPARASSARGWLKTRKAIISCERCSYDEHPEILVVHHRDHDRRNNEPRNLEVLCPNCHALEHHGDREAKKIAA